jgi:flavodoxin
MKTVVVYDSIFGNTAKIAEAIGAELGKECALFKVTEATPETFSGADLVVVGSPTRAFRPTPAIKALLGKIGRDALAGVKAASFDTRLSVADVNNGLLTFMVRIFGYAAAPMSKTLGKKGARLLLPAEGFFVKASEGPLKEGELERAVDWGKKLKALAKG